MAPDSSLTLKLDTEGSQARLPNTASLAERDFIRNISLDFLFMLASAASKFNIQFCPLPLQGSYATLNLERVAPPRAPLELEISALDLSDSEPLHPVLEILR